MLLGKRRTVMRPGMSCGKWRHMVTEHNAAGKCPGFINQLSYQVWTLINKMNMHQEPLNLMTVPLFIFHLHGSHFFIILPASLHSIAPIRDAQINFSSVYGKTDV